MSVNDWIMCALYTLCAATWGTYGVLCLSGTRRFELSRRAAVGLIACVISLLPLLAPPIWLILPAAAAPMALAGAVAWARNGHAPAVVERVVRSTGWGDIR